MKRRNLFSAFLAAAAASELPAQRLVAQPRPTDRVIDSGAAPSDNGTPQSSPDALIDVRRYGIVANDTSAATANTVALRSLLDPRKAGPTGWIIFPNASGNDIYHFNGVIPIRDGIYIDLMGGTLSYSGAAAQGDRNSGLFFALRDFACQNGAIEVSCDTSAATGSGHAIQIGARGTDSSHFTVWDSQLPSPLGNIQLRNLRLTLRNTGTYFADSAAIGILGGVQNLVAENIVIDGSGTLPLGINYEFGWATNDSDPRKRQTSHAHNMKFTNIIAKNLSAKGGTAVSLVGAYSCIVEGLYVTSAQTAFLCYPGESMFYRPWTRVDQAGVKRAILVRNLVAQSLSGTAIVFTGAQTASHGYMSALFATLQRQRQYGAETDLGDFSLDGFGISDGSGWGIYTSAGRAMIRNGTIQRCQRGIVITDECTKLLVEGVDVLDCQQHGMQLDIGLSLWNPPRTKKVGIRDCYIAGNSSASPGRFAGIEIGPHTDSALIENCRFGYEVPYAGIPEVSQGPAVLISSAGASNVICRANHVGGVAAQDAGAYNNSATGNASANGNAIEHATGITTTSGNWIIDSESDVPQPITTGGRIWIRGLRVVKVNPGTSVTGISLEPGYQSGQIVTIINEAPTPKTVTFAAQARSNIAGQTADSIAGLMGHRYVWDARAHLWYRT